MLIDKTWCWDNRVSGLKIVVAGITREWIIIFVMPLFFLVNSMVVSVIELKR